MKPGVSLAMIVRNDASRIERCLASVAPYVEEMIVVDTGSTDGTQEIARRLGARVIEREWPDDFAQALNWAFEEVSCEWTLRLDSDEWLLPESVSALKEALGRTDVFAYSVLIQNFVADGRFTEQRALRLWRTSLAMRLTGFVHEQFLSATLDLAASGRVLADSSVRFGHDGYAVEAMPEKHRRNLALIEKELAARPGSKYYESERARILALLGDPRAASANDLLIDELLSLTHLETPPSIMVSGPLTLVLDRLPDADLASQRTTDILRLARGWFPDEPSVTYVAAKTFIRRGDLRSALDALLDLERMAETGDYSRAGFTHPSMLEEALWQNLALVAHQLGRKDIAARNYARLLARDPNHPVAKRNMQLLLGS